MSTDGEQPSEPARTFDPMRKPVELGQELDATVTEISRKGDGVVRIEGFVIFVPNTKEGQQVRIRITSIRPNFATAEVVQPA